MLTATHCLLLYVVARGQKSEREREKVRRLDNRRKLVGENIMDVY